MQKICFSEKNSNLQVALEGQNAILQWSEIGNRLANVSINICYNGAYGMGEKFDYINQKGNNCVNEVVEKFCNQGNISYLTMPFFFLDAGLGVYFKTYEKTKFDFKDTITCTVPLETEVYLFTGTPAKIISEFTGLFGEVIVPPSYTFGPWISANHWNNEKMVQQVVNDLEKYDFPATVLVLEAWSDEATFYIFNGAKYIEKKNGKAFSYEDFDFSESKYWKNPKKLIQELNAKGIKTVLWQIPVYKKMEEGIVNKQNQLDKEDAIERELCIRNSDGTPYEIPNGNWFEGSLIPDYTNKETRRTWFNRRQYLLDIGVAGFKTDGGEFIYKKNIIANNGMTGTELKNQFCQQYINAYHEFTGNDHVLFSRAGFSGAQITPSIWAGDHQSTWEELRNAYRAAITSACSGIAFWGYDIGGFAGELPSLDLYRKSTQFACFTPIMQWHSEPDGGQFKDLMPGGTGNNERSPWNIALINHQEQFIDEMRYWYKLRMNLLPYIYSEAIKAAESGAPMMRPIFYEGGTDQNLWKNEDEYYFGESLMVAPLLEENQKNRTIYLPEGTWMGLFSGETYEGNQYISSEKEKYPVFVKGGKAVVMQIPMEELEKRNLGNQTSDFKKLTILRAGESGEYLYKEEQKSQLLKW